ncbi:MAG: outer membrane protein transport protein [Proteobacteria bacterium]|nr:outer membrane protein transport protein [Pseudomonadota bacterium]
MQRCAFRCSTREILAAVALLTALLATPKPARSAGALSWFGNEARSAAMGGAGSGAGGGPGQLLANPAFMSFHEGGLWMTFSVSPSFLHIRPKDRPAGYDIPDSIYQSHPSGWGIDRPVPTSLFTHERGDTSDIDPTMLLSIVAIGSIFHEDLRVGLGFTTPLPGIISIRTWYNDEREQHFSNRLHFERFGEFDSAMTFYPGLSFSPLDWFSAGLTLQIDLAMALDSRIFLTESTTWDYSYLNTGGRVVPIVRPIVGLAFRTPFGLGLGVVYRHEAYTAVDVDIDIRVWNGERYIEDTGELKKNFGQSHRNVFGYKPKEIAVSASYERKRFSAELVGTVELWSDYLDRHANQWTHPVAPGDTQEVSWQDPRFDDVVSVRAGAEMRITDLFALRAGAAYSPSPMPSQTGRYNYVDNDLLLYSLGAGWRFDVRGHTVTADLAAQLWQMIELTVLKSRIGADQGGIVDEVPDTVTDFDGVPLADGQGLQTNNPGFPGYELGGFALNLALTLGVVFD